MLAILATLLNIPKLILYNFNNKFAALSVNPFGQVICGGH